MSLDHRDDMALPAGMDCKDCRWLRRCSTLLGIPPGNRTCDFSPSRFEHYVTKPTAGEPW